MPNEVFKSSGQIVAYPTNRLLQHQGIAVLQDGNEIEENRGAAVVTIADTVPSHMGYVVKAEPNSLIHAFGFAVKERPENHVISPNGVIVTQLLFPPYEDLSIEHPFVEQRFPTHISYGSSGGPGFRTSLFSVDNGIATAQAEWDRLRGRYSVEFDFATGADVEAVEQFFYGMRGKGLGFRFKDWSDYQITNQVMAVGDGVSRQFQVFKRYESGGFFFDRIIKKPRRESALNMTVDGVEVFLGFDYYINNATGTLIFDEAPPAGSIVEIGYLEFDVPVRFDTDEMMVSAVEHDQYEINQLELIEILV